MPSPWISTPARAALPWMLAAPLVIGACGGLLGVDFGDARPYPPDGGPQNNSGDDASTADGSHPSDGSPDDRAADGDGPTTNTDGSMQGDGAMNDADAAPPVDGGALVGNQASPRAIAVDGANVYWTNMGASQGQGSVMVMPKGGGAITTLGSAQSDPTAMAVQGGYVYWTNNGSGSVMFAPTGGPPNSATSIAFAQSAPYAVVADSSFVYWVDQGTGNDGILMKALLDGGSPTAVVSNLLGPGAVALVGTNAYLALDTGGIVYTPLAGGGGLTDFKYDGTGGVIANLVSDGTNLFWTDLGIHTVYQFASDGSGPGGIAGSQEPEGVTTDGVHVYWTDRGQGTVNKTPVGGGPSVVVASGQGSPWGVAVDGTDVYWTAEADGTVNRAPK